MVDESMTAVHRSSKKDISHIIRVLGRISEQIELINPVSQAYKSELKIQKKIRRKLK